MLFPSPRPLGLVLLGAFVALAASASAAVTYVPFTDPAVVTTGVRSTSATTDGVVLTASYVENGITYAGLYAGSLAASPGGTFTALTPVFSGQTVSSATFYGPNTPRFDPRLGVGNLIAVGSYKYAEGTSGPNADHGMMYVGPVTGGGTWTQIDATPLLAQGETLLNTIAHSTMGDLVVGNYDTSLATGNAFIYNRITNEWTDLNPGNTASVTAYGIWQNGGPTSTSYTIAGGQSSLNATGLDDSYLLHYDSATKAITHYKIYRYNDRPAGTLLCHFDGITANADNTGYNLTGTFTDGPSARGFYATIRTLPDGSFSDAQWTEIAYPGSVETTGNTVVENFVLGIFVGGGGTRTYLATVGPATPPAPPATAGVRVSASKSQTRTTSRATYLVTNTGTATDTFTLRRHRDVTNRFSGPAPASPGRAPFTISFTRNGSPFTKALEAGTATTGPLAPGQSAKIVETVKARGRVAFQRTIRTTLTATSQSNPSAAANAKVTLKLDPQP